MANDVGEKVREKKRLCHKFLRDKTVTNWRMYEEGKEAAKKVVGVTKATRNDDINKKLETVNDSSTGLPERRRIAGGR